jgi:hypothetical protein
VAPRTSTTDLTKKKSILIQQGSQEHKNAHILTGKYKALVNYDPPLYSYWNAYRRHECILIFLSTASTSINPIGGISPYR